MTTSSGDPNEVYALGVDPAERERLQRQADELAPESKALLDQLRLRPGDAAIDLGCGPLGVLHLLHERVGPGGRVVGLDADETHVATAGAVAAGDGLTAVEVVHGDARKTGLPGESFDVVHARLLLINIPQPADVVAEMVRLARPGGWVAGLEFDLEHWICYPPNPAYARLMEIFTDAFARIGADPCIGRRVAELYRAAGLVDIGVEARATVYPAGHSRRTAVADVVRVLRPRIITLGLADADELADLDAVARAHVAQPDTVVMPHLSFLVRGRKAL